MRTHLFWPLALLALTIGDARIRAQDLSLPSDSASSSSKRPRTTGTYVRISGTFSRNVGGIIPSGRRGVLPINLGMTVQPIVIMPTQSSSEMASGVDLDVVRPSQRFPARDQTKPEKAAPPETPPLPGIDLSRPKPPAPKEEQGVPADPSRLMDLGMAAAAREEYGKAASRFRQVTEAAQHMALGYFLRAQAEFALGQAPTDGRPH
jgi:hypothetical protein